jgi:ketosteroid isomerase-like protein
MKTAEAENKRLVARLHAQGWASGDFAVFDEVYSTNHGLHWNEGTPTLQRRTTEELKAIVREYRAAFPDLEVTIDNMAAAGDMVAVQVRFEGTHEKPYESYPPTHRKSRFTDMQILRLVGGKIVESFLGSGGLRYFWSILDGTAFR